MGLWLGAGDGGLTGADAAPIPHACPMCQPANTGHLLWPPAGPPACTPLCASACASSCGRTPTGAAGRAGGAALDGLHVWPSTPCAHAAVFLLAQHSARAASPPPPPPNHLSTTNHTLIHTLIQPLPNKCRYSCYVVGDESYEAYCRKMARPTTWGDHVTLQARRRQRQR